MKSYLGINPDKFLKAKNFIPALAKWRNEQMPLAALMASSVLTIALAIFSTHTLIKSINKVIHSELQQTTLVLKVSAQNIFDALGDELKSEASSQSLRNSLADYQFGESYVRPQLASIIESQPSILKLVLKDATGRIISYAGHEKIDVADNTAPPEKPYIPEKQELKFENEQIATIITPIYFPPTGINEGVLEATVSLDLVKGNIFKNIPAEKREKITLKFLNDSTKLPAEHIDPYFINSRESEEIRFHLLGNFSKNYIRAFYTENTSEQQHSMLLAMLLNLSGLASTWLLFFIFIKWTNIRYVEPINKITKAARELLNPTAKTENIKQNRDETAIKQLQDAVMMAVDSISVTEFNYREKISITYAELDRTRQRLEQITSSGGIIALSINLATGLVYYATKSATELLKVESPGLQPHWRDVIKNLPRKQRAILLQCIKNISRDKPATTEIKISRNGKERIYDVRLYYASKNRRDITRIDCIAFDNTEKSSAVKALLESEGRKTAIVNGALDGLLMLDSNLFIIDANPAAEKIFNQPNVELLGKYFLDYCIAPGYQKKFLAITKQLENSTGPRAAHGNEPIWCKNNNQVNFPVEMNASLVSSDSGTQVCLYLKDLRETYKQQNEIALKTAEIETVFSLSPDGFAAFNEKNLLSSFNQALRNLFETDEDQIYREMTHEEFWLLLEKISYKPKNEQISKRLKPGETVLQLHTERPKLIKYSKGMTREGSLMKSTIYYFNDITAEYQLNVMKNNFLATAAHELRTPLTTIQGFSELLTKKSLPVETQNDLLGSIHRQSLRLSSLINDLLDLAKIDAEGIQQIKAGSHDLKEIINGLLGNVTTRSAGKLFYGKTEIIADFDSTIPLMANCDPEKIYRVINNLLSNSAKYNKNNNPIILRARKIESEKQQSIEISVIDRGIGMSKKELAAAFERFWRSDHTSGSVPGTGLGLSLVKEIIEMHGGSVHLDSTLGEGTTATITLPPPQEHPTRVTEPDVTS